MSVELILTFGHNVPLISAGSEQSGAEATNLITGDRGSRWRSVALSPTADTYLRPDLVSTTTTVDTLYLLGSNHTDAATWRIRGHTAVIGAATSTVYDSGWIAMAVATPLGRRTPERTAVHHLLDGQGNLAGQALRYWRIDVDDQTNPDGHYEAALVELGESLGYRLPLEVDLRVRDDSRVDRARGYPWRRRGRSWLEARITPLTLDAERGLTEVLQLLGRTVGLSGAVGVSILPREAEAHATSLWGLLSEEVALAYDATFDAEGDPRAWRWRSALSFEEL